MRYFKRFFVLALAVIISTSIIGCSASNEAQKDTGQIVAEVNDEKIYMEDVIDIYNQEKEYYGITEEVEQDPEQAEALKQFKLDILEQLVYEKLIAQKAKEAGFEITDEIKNKASDEFNFLVENVAGQIMTQDMQSGEANVQDKDYIKEAKDYVASQLETMGKTEEEYIDLIAKDILIGNFFDEVSKNIEATDEDIQYYYDSQLAMQKVNGSSTGEEVVLFEPASVTVKHILISLPQEEKDEYNNLVAEGKSEEAKNYLNEKLKNIKGQADEVLEKVKSGEDFESLIVEYGEDPGMSYYENGYVVQRNGQFVVEFEDAAFKLEKGQVSDLVATSHGYHIIKAYDRQADKAYGIDEKRAEIKETLDTQKKNEEWNRLIEEWKNNSNIKKYEDKI